MGECPVAAFGDAGAGCGGGDVGVDPDSAQLIRRPEAVAGGAGGEPHVDVGVELGDGGGVESTWWWGCQPVLVAPGELQGDDVPGNSEASLEPLPRRALSDVR